MKSGSRIHHFRLPQILLIGGALFLMVGSGPPKKGDVVTIDAKNAAVSIAIGGTVSVPPDSQWTVEKQPIDSEFKGTVLRSVENPSLKVMVPPEQVRLIGEAAHPQGQASGSRNIEKSSKASSMFSSSTPQPSGQVPDCNAELSLTSLDIMSVIRPTSQHRIPASNLPKGAPVVAAPDDAESPPDTNAPTSLPGSPTSQINNNTAPTFQTATEAAAIALANSDNQSGVELAAASVLSRQVTQRSASDDQHTVSEPYRDIPIKQMGSYLERAQGALSEAAEMLETSTDSSLEPSEKARFRNYMLNARDKAGLGMDMIREDERREEQLGANSPFTGFLGMADANPMAKSAALAELFGTKLPTSAAATTADALVNRLVMYNGLPADVQAQLRPKLKLAEMTRFKLPNGKVQNIPILHNGYILGGGGSAMDCSSFVSSILPSDVRKGRFTTLDFHTMWRYRKHGVFPSPPKYSAERAKLVKETATAFTAIDLYAGERLLTGDLLIYRVLDEPIGHIFIVRSFNPTTLETEVIEAAQSAGTIRERDFALSVDPLDAPERYIRPGLMALRLKPTNNRACSYREHGRLPAAKSPGQGVAQ